MRRLAGKLWQVTPRSSVMGLVSLRAIHFLNRQGAIFAQPCIVSSRGPKTAVTGPSPTPDRKTENSQCNSVHTGWFMRLRRAMSQSVETTFSAAAAAGAAVLVSMRCYAGCGTS